MKNNTINAIIRLASFKKKNMLLIIFLSFLSSLFDAASLASLYPVLNIISGKSESFIGGVGILDRFTSMISSNGIMTPIHLGVVMLITFTILKLLTSYFAEVIGKYSQFSIGMSLQKKIFNILMNVDYQSFIKENKGDSLFKLQVAPGEAQKLFLMIPAMIDGIFKLTLTLFLLIIISPKYTLYSGAVFILYFIFSQKIFTNISYKTGKERTDINSKMSEVSLNMLKGTNSIRIFNTQNYWLTKFNKQCDRFIKIATRNEFFVPLPSKFLELVIILGISITALGIFFSNNNLTNSLPSLGVFALGFLRLIPTLKSIGLILIRIGDFGPFAEKIFKKIDSVDLDNNSFGDKKIKKFNSLTIDKVFFNYSNSNKQILKNISNEIKKGEFIAIVGDSGSGKTTLLNLIIGVLKPIKGNILINGNNIFKYNKEDFSKIYGYVGQDPFLYNDSIKNNIIFGRDDIDEKSIILSLKQAELYDFIQTLPDGINYNISDDGMNFSGGQRQRIMLARAFVQNPSVLLLDEATSALDQGTESRIMKTISNYVTNENKTVIFITHRKIAVSNADKIFFIKEGVINKIYIKGTSEFSDYIFKS